MTSLLTFGIVAIICGVIGYFIGKGNNKTLQNDDHNYKSDLEACKHRNIQLQNDLETLRSQAKKSTVKKTHFASEPNIPNAIIAFNANEAKAVFGKKIKEDDLKIVEGIGPKIEELFKTSGILTWKRLSETSVDRCNKILDKAGERYRIHDPGTWPRQAQLAYEGKWQELKSWQERLDKGKEK